jgi:hypothetical protein
MAPPPLAPFPGALFPQKLLLVIVAPPVFTMAPPWSPMLPEKVLLVTSSVPPWE